MWLKHGVEWADCMKILSDQKSHAYFFQGIVLCFLGAICFSTKAIFVKLAYRETSVDAVSLLALRMLFALPFFVTSAAVSSGRQANVRFTLKQWLGVAVVGCLGYYISSLLDFIGLQYVSAGMERLILFIYPTFVLLITALLFKQRISGVQVVALVITYAGLFIAFFSEIKFTADAADNTFFGVLMILACAFTFGSYIVGSGRLIPVVGATKFNSYAMSFACVAVLIHFFIVSDQSLFQFSPLIYGHSLLMAIVSTVVPSYLISVGIKRIGSGNAAIVGSIGPVSTILQAYFFLEEPITVLQIAGTLLILLGVLVIGRRKRSAEASQ